MPRTHFFTVAFIIWIMFITFSSLYSFSSVGAPSFDIPHLDKVVHFVFYFIACILGVFFIRERTLGELSLMKALMFMFFATALFGTLIEGIQHIYTPNRVGDVYDGLANSAGSFFGALVAKLFFSGKRQLNWKH